MDRKFASLFVPFFLLMVGPYIFAWLWPSPGNIFAGFLLNPIDGNSYLAKMMEGWRGEWGFTLPYTAQKGAGAPIFLFYIALGHIARITTIPMIGVFHLARVMGLLFLFWQIYQFSILIFPGSKRQQREASALALFGAGLGWLFILFGIILSDVWIAEGYPFLSSYSSPHFTIGMALLVRIFIYQLQPDSLRKSLILVATGLLLSVIMPFGLVVACVVSGLWVIFEWFKLRRFAWTSLFSFAIPGGLFLCYQYWIINQDPLLSLWNAQNLTPAPPVWDFFLSFTPALILAGWPSWNWFRNNATTPAQRLILIWIISGVILLYFPFSLQRRFIFALFIPVSFAAVAGLHFIRARWPLLTKSWIPFLWITSTLTNAMVILLAVFGVISQQPIYFVSQDEAAGFGYIQAALPADALILCSPETGLFLPAWTGRRVLFGHEFETIHAGEQKDLVSQLLDGKLSVVQQSDRMKQEAIQYVFIGPREQKFGSPDFRSYMKPVFQNATVTIYSW